VQYGFGDTLIQVLKDVKWVLYVTITCGAEPYLLSSFFRNFLAAALFCRLCIAYVHYVATVLGIARGKYGWTEFCLFGTIHFVYQSHVLASIVARHFGRK
jgi:hypothetical protein